MGSVHQDSVIKKIVLLGSFIATFILTENIFNKTYDKGEMQATKYGYNFVKTHIKGSK